MMVVQHNLASMFTQRELKTITGEKSKSTEKLSSGYKINRSADDAAGLAISEKMRWQIRGLDRASQNIQDGISYVQTGEGALNEVHSMLQRIRELSVQAANDTNTKTDRENLDAEVQQIKEEIEQIFNDTEFNTKKIFRAPYIPTIKNEPQDFAMFNVGPGGSETGGVLINKKRYSWEELGLDEAWNTPSSEDRTFTFYDRVTDQVEPGDPDLEEITLLLKAGETLPNVHRVYGWTADENGILINGIYAGKWDDTIQQDGDTYSFSHHGCDYSFTADPGASRDSIIDHLNPDNISRLTWEAVPSSIDTWDALHSTADSSMKLYVTNANKEITAGTNSDIEEWKYSIVADDKEVGIVQQNFKISDGVPHTKTEWKNFKNTDTGEEEYPIVDFGTDSSDTYNKYNPVIEKNTNVPNPANQNPVTLDEEATYHYGDVVTARQPESITFDFTFLRNETGKAEAIKALNQTLNSTGVIAPIEKISLKDNTNTTVLSFSGLDFHFQRDQLLRDFGVNGDEENNMPITLVREKVVDVDEYNTYQYRNTLSEAYVGWKALTKTTNYTETGTVLVTESSTGDITYDKSSFSATGLTEKGSSSKYSIKVEEEDKLIGAIPGSKASKTKTSDEPVYGELGGRVSEITEHDDGTKTYLATISRDITKEETQFLERDGLYYKVTMDNGSEEFIKSNTDDAFVYLNNYDPEDPDLLRDVNRAVYEKADSANDGKQRYVVKNGASEVQLDKTYKLCHYEYKILNSAGNEIMTGHSDSFVDTGESTDILDSFADAVKDQEIGVNRKDSEGRYILKQKAENIDDSIDLILKGTNPSGEEYYYSATKQTDQSIRNIVFSGKNIDNQISTITIQYNDHEDTDGNKNKSVKGEVDPDGKAYRDFSKPARTAGTALEQNFRIKMNPPEKLLHIQSGAKGWQSIDIKYPALTNAIIGIGSSAVKTWGQASSAISEMDEAIEMISKIRTTFGVYHNRLEYAYSIDQNTSENTQAAESRVRDTDMAKEMVSYSKSNILAQAAQSMLTQTNQQPQWILALLQ